MKRAREGIGGQSHQDALYQSIFTAGRDHYRHMQLTVALGITKICSTTSGLREHLRGLGQKICAKIVSSVQNSEAALLKCQKYSHLSKAIIIIPVAILIQMEKSHRYYPQMKTSMLPSKAESISMDEPLADYPILSSQHQQIHSAATLIYIIASFIHL